MDYEKLYKEAIERAKSWAKGEHPECFSEAQKAVDFIFPELKESEDEKIRKVLIKGFQHYDKECKWGEFTTAEILSWLEKQGKETSWKPSKEEMDVLYGLSYITNEFDERKEEVIMRLYQDLKRVFFNGASFENMFPTNISIEIEKQGEKDSQVMYPAFSFDDILALQCYMKTVKEVQKDEELYKQLQSLHDRLHDVYWLEKQGEQKSIKNIMNVWKDMRLEVYQQASGNRNEPNYSDDTTKMFSLNDIDEIIEKMSEQNPTPKFKFGDTIHKI